MPTDAGTPRKKQKTGKAILAAVIVLFAVGAVALFFLGQPLPEEAVAGRAGRTAAAPPLAFGDRVERRLDAIIDGNKPQWTERVEKRLETFADKIGWD